MFRYILDNVMTDDQKITILKALADPVRLGIVRGLGSEQCTRKCSELSEASSLSQPSMSHHFAKLIAAGVITENKQGREKSYALNVEVLVVVGIDIDKLTQSTKLTKGKK
jgi:ArsR family transcriptional regulator